MVQEIHHHINGTETPSTSHQQQPIINPATGHTTATLHLGNTNDVNTAVAAAKTASTPWAALSQARRQAILFRFRNLLATHTNELAHTITTEHGKTLSDAHGEIARGQEVVEYACAATTELKGEYSSQAATGIDVYSYRQPLGVIAGITPFNFPAMVPLWMAPLAIATGNTFILKPSERVPSAANYLADLWTEAGLPPGVFNVIHGTKECVDTLLAHPDIDGISFVGSTTTARHIYETGTRHGKRVQALGGAKNHALIMPDADMNLAAEHLTTAAFGSAGQRCMAISVAVTVGTATETILTKVTEQAKTITVAAGTTEGADMGPVITASARDRIHRIIDEAEKAGAHIALDGRNLTIPGYENGYFIGPTIIDHITTEMRAYQEEIFGPVLILLHVENLEEGIKLINTNPYGNGTCIFTSSGAAARTFRRDIQTGMVGINVPLPVPVAWHSFGGWKNSLFGEHHIYGPDGIHFYTRNKVITERWPTPQQTPTTSYAMPTTSTT